jgi:hypothetical protein
MQLPTHLITAVMIDKLTQKSQLPRPARLTILAGACYLSHGILDKIARATYHPPDPLDDRFWVIYHHNILPTITWSVIGNYGTKHWFAMLFSALPDLDWVIRDNKRKYGQQFPGWNGPLLNEGLHTFLNHIPVLNFLNRLPDLRFQRKGVLVELGLVALIFAAIRVLDRKK